jgi:hypothetical protein
LATFYKNGLIDDTEEDQPKKAFDLYQQAADKDDAMSWHALSTYYYNDDHDDDDLEVVVPVNFDMAVTCLKKSEELGYSMYLLIAFFLYM